ncbi:hypothetical protein LJR230_004014 [Trinickia sp. LjRoot230]|uniref:hypothetical protein n=1 Tax=Trinickia sp. LjRoot230 TaxID=3342288 RepID=UPI003ECE0473
MNQQNQDLLNALVNVYHDDAGRVDTSTLTQALDSYYVAVKDGHVAEATTVHNARIDRLQAQINAMTAQNKPADEIANVRATLADAKLLPTTDAPATFPTSDASGGSTPQLPSWMNPGG